MNNFVLKPQVLIALLAAGTMAFHSCKDKNEVIQNDPGATAPAESVKTSFAFNLPQVGKTGTRMSADATQNNNNFLGMYSIKLLPRNATEATGNGFTSIIDLAPIGNTDLNNNQKIYSDISIPVGTTNFLFYGIGGENAPKDATEKFAEGVLTATIDGQATTAGITFALEKVTADATAGRNDLLTVLNAVAGAAGWKDYADNESTLPDEQKSVLTRLYENFTSLKAGSAKMICLTLQDLYNAVYGFASSTSTPEPQETTIAKLITDEIENVFDIITTNGIHTLEYKIANTYPENCNLPQGAAQVEFNKDPLNPNTFRYIDNADINSTTIATSNICFPASLYYFTNTAAWATDAVSPTWPTTWAGYDWAANGWYSPVRESTHAIALANNIQYSVASLKTTVKCANVTKLPDAATPTPNQITIPTDGFPVTGILIAGQPNSVNWAFNSTETDATKHTQIIYDNALTGMKAKQDAAEGTNYTLLLANKIGNDDTTPQASVSMVIELENTSGVSFQGKDGVVPVGAKFYLVATLNPGAGNGVTNNTGLTNPAVFMQDYVTTANLTINSLANASVTIPDLRNTEMSLGISVDLEWQAGLVFDVTIQ